MSEKMNSVQKVVTNSS